MRRLVIVLAALAATAPPAARAEHVESIIGPGEPMREFPAAFLALLPKDHQAEIAAFPQWNDRRVGGWADAVTGDKDCAPDWSKRPVVFVHGTTEDAWFWRNADSGDGTIVNVRNRLLQAGYCPQQLYAISYTGARGYFTYNDINANEIYRFFLAVRNWLGTKHGYTGTVDVVSHSLGVTVVRKAATVEIPGEPALGGLVHSYVAIAGANHGTTTCRGVGTLHGSHVCEELEPGSAWLAALNGANGENEHLGERAMVIYSSANTDNFYLGPDVESPRLKGAVCTKDMALAHNTLARGDAAVKAYMAFLATGACT